MSEFKIEIKNFQSLKDVKLTLIDGINIITGKTNEGKSAVFRAIDTALFNLGNDDMVRSGQRYAGILLDNGTHKLFFCRDSHGKNEKTAYQFDDGTVQKKVGKGQLPEVATYFNIRDVRMQNGTKMKLNFWYQNDKPFLMDKSPYQLYDFLSLSSCDKYMTILKQMNADMKVQNAEIASLTTEIDTLKSVNDRKSKFLDRNEGYEDLYLKIYTMYQKKKEADIAQGQLSTIEVGHQRREDAQTRLDKVTQALSKIPFEDVKSDIKGIFTRDSEIVSQLLENQKLVADRETLTSLEKKLSVVSGKFADGNKVVTEVAPVLSVLFNEDNSIQQILLSYNTIESICKKKQVAQDKLDKVSGKSVSVEEQRVLQETLTDLSNTESLVDDLVKELSGLESVRLRIQSKTSKLDETVQELADKEAEFEELKKSAGYCPYCGTIFEKESV